MLNQTVVRPRVAHELIDLGIAWLPITAAIWRKKQLKRLVKLQSGLGITSEEIHDEGEFPVFGGNGFRGYAAIAPHCGDYWLIGRQGALCGNVNRVTGQAWVSEHALIAYAEAEFDMSWMGCNYSGAIG